MEVLSILSSCDKPKYSCEICDYNTSRKSDINRHLKSKCQFKREMRKENAQNAQNAQINNIDTINHIDTITHVDTINHIDTITHVDTINHIDTINHVDITDKNASRDNNNAKHYKCETCDKIYVNSGGLWKHKQKCTVIKEQETEDVLTNAIINLLSQHNELRNIVMEQNKQNFELTTQTINDISKHITSELVNAVKTNFVPSVINNNTMNNSNNTFNLNLFLNETCKDALNIDEFINNIQVTNADLEETARLGYSNGIGRIFVNELNALDVTKKPIHCSDMKRETIYIKENNVWEKDNNDKTKLVEAIKKVARKNYMHIFEWEKTYPKCKTDFDSKERKQYNKIVSNSMIGGTDAEITDNINKIVKIVIKNSVIDKTVIKGL